MHTRVLTDTSWTNAERAGRSGRKETPSQGTNPEESEPREETRISAQAAVSRENDPAPILVLLGVFGFSLFRLVRSPRVPSRLVELALPLVSGPPRIFSSSLLSVTELH